MLQLRLGWLYWQLFNSNHRQQYCYTPLRTVHSMCFLTPLARISEILPLNFKEHLMEWQRKQLKTLSQEILLLLGLFSPLLLSSWQNIFNWTEEISKHFCKEKVELNIFCCRCTGPLPGPRNWHPRALTAAQRLAESCWGFWCCRMSSVTVLSPSERAALMALTRPSSSTSWQFTSVTSFLCMGRLSALWFKLATPSEKGRKGKAALLIKFIWVRQKKLSNSVCLSLALGYQSQVPSLLLGSSV